MRTLTASDAAKAVVRRNTEEVQGKGNFDVFEELFADDFVDHTSRPPRCSLDELKPRTNKTYYENESGADQQTQGRL
jgi:hypothetical protein